MGIVHEVVSDPIIDSKTTTFCSLDVRDATSLSPSKMVTIAVGINNFQLILAKRTRVLSKCLNSKLKQILRQ